MHVHILGLVSLNGGDAAILVAQDALIRSRWPEATVTVSDTHADVAARYLPRFSFTPFLLPELKKETRLHQLSGRVGMKVTGSTLRRVRAAASLIGRGSRRAGWNLLTPRERRLLAPLVAADVIAYTGGTTLTDNYDLTSKLFDLDIARRLGTPLVFLPQSAGPFRKEENRAGLRPILSAADRVLVRDERSLGHVIDVGAPPERSRVVPDVVFALTLDDEHLDQRVSVGDTESPRVAVSVREWAYFRDKSTADGMRDYLGSLRAAVTAVVRQRSARVTFVSTCQGRPEYVRDDSVFAQEVFSGLPVDVLPAVEVDAEARTPEELIDFLSGFDAMLSTRLHGAISAVCTLVPTMTIAYEFKTTEVWKQLDMSEWSVEIDDLTPDSLAERCVALLDAGPSVRERLRASVPPLRDAVLVVADDIAAVRGRVG